MVATAVFILVKIDSPSIDGGGRCHCPYVVELARNPVMRVWFGDMLDVGPTVINFILTTSFVGSHPELRLNIENI